MLRVEENDNHVHCIQNLVCALHSINPQNLEDVGRQCDEDDELSTQNRKCSGKHYDYDYHTIPDHDNDDETKFDLLTIQAAQANGKAENTQDNPKQEGKKKQEMSKIVYKGIVIRK